MPTISLAVPEHHESVTRPIVKDILTSIIKLTNLPTKTRIVYLGATGKAAHQGSMLTEDPDVILTRNLFPTDGRVLVEVTEEYLEEAALTTAVDYPENVVVFRDDLLDISVTPVYAKTQLTLTIRQRFPDQNAADRWLSSIRRHVNIMRVENIHKVTYHYSIPDEFLIILYNIHGYRERVAGYGEDLKTWMQKCYSHKVTTLLNQNGAKALLSVAESQTGIIGWFDFTFVPTKAEMDRETGAWEASFTYNIVYDKATDCVMRYPLMVHNQLLNSKFRPDSVPFTPEKELTTPSFSRVLFDAGTWGYPGPGYAIPGISIPKYDDWLPLQDPPFTSCLLRIMIQLDPTNLRDVISLRELGNYKIDGDILDFLALRPADMLILGESFIKVTLFRNRLPIAENLVTIDSDLHIESTEDLSLRTQYHVHVALLHDLSILSDRAREHLRMHADVCIKLLKILDSTLEEKGLLPAIIGDNYIARRDLDRVIDHLEEHFLKYRNHQRYITPNVGVFGVFVHDRSPTNATTT